VASPHIQLEFMFNVTSFIAIIHLLLISVLAETMM